MRTIRNLRFGVLCGAVLLAVPSLSFAADDCRTQISSVRTQLNTSEASDESKQEALRHLSEAEAVLMPGQPGTGTTSTGATGTTGTTGTTGGSDTVTTTTGSGAGSGPGSGPGTGIGTKMGTPGMPGTGTDDMMGAAAPEAECLRHLNLAKEAAELN